MLYRSQSPLVYSHKTHKALKTRSLAGGFTIEEVRLRAVLESLKSGELSVDQVVSQMRDLPYEDLEFAKVDHHRSIRQGFPEVIFGQGKTPEHIAEIASSVLSRSDRLLGHKGEAGGLRGDGEEGGGCQVRRFGQVHCR